MSLCKHFIIDTVGNGFGVGNCQKMVDYKAKGATDKMCEKVRREQLGTKLFSYYLCDEERGCLKYESE